MGATTLEIDSFTLAVESRGTETVLAREISLAVEKGQTLCIVGESGSGKTVTAMSVARLLEFTAPVVMNGSISIDGANILDLSQSAMRRERSRKIGIVFQEGLGSLNPAKRIGNQLIERWTAYANYAEGTPREGARARRRFGAGKAYELLLEVGLTDAERLMNQYPHQLSGGMQQRVMIAMALMCDPHVLIADEPTTALDVTTQAEILALIMRVQRKHQTACVFITHDMGVAAEIADRIAVMYRGHIVENEATERILTAPAHPYTRALLACVPQLGSNYRDGFPAIHRESLTQAVDQGKLDAMVTRLPQLPPRAAAPRSAPAIELSDVVKEFKVRRSERCPSGRFRAVNGVTLRIEPGEFFGLVGESGSGKTTLGRMVAALEAPTSGTISIGDHTIGPKGLTGDERAFRRSVQLVFQDPQSSLDPRMLAQQSVAEPLEALKGLKGRELQDAADALLEEVGLPAGTGAKYPSQLSGGQRQRVAIARALAAEPSFIVADEPTSALDVSVQGQVMNVLLGLQRRRGLGFMFVTHNLSLVLSIADRIGVMKNGEIVEIAAPKQILQNPQHPYTRRLLAANPEFGSDDALRTVS